MLFLCLGPFIWREQLEKHCLYSKFKCILAHMHWTTEHKSYVQFHCIFSMPMEVTNGVLILQDSSTSKSKWTLEFDVALKKSSGARASMSWTCKSNKSDWLSPLDLIVYLCTHRKKITESTQFAYISDLNSQSTKETCQLSKIHGIL